MFCVILQTAPSGVATTEDTEETQDQFIVPTCPKMGVTGEASRSGQVTDGSKGRTQAKAFIGVSAVQAWQGSKKQFRVGWFQ